LIRRAKKIGNITLTRSLYYVDDFAAQRISAVSEETIDGGVVVWEQENKIIRDNVTLDSLENYPILEDELIAHQDMCDNTLGSVFDITLTDNTTVTVRFKHEEGAIDSSPIYEGACYYNVTLKFANV
jgi:hypothetical protein